MLVNITKNKIIVEKVQIADTFFRRLKGLLGTNSLPSNCGLLISPCNSVHTFGMRYPITVLFIDEHDIVLKTVDCLKPGRLAWCPQGAYVIELPAGTVNCANITVGDQLKNI